MTGSCQRWTHRHGSWRHPSEDGFNPAHYSVAPVREGLARAFVVQHHNDGTFPTSRLCYGLHDRHDRHDQLVGVAVLSIPMRAKVLTLPLPTLAPYREFLELGRFVLLNEVPANAESWFLGQTWRLAADAGVRGIVSLSDPMPRHRVLTLHDGREVIETITAGRVGVIYQATNGIPAGRSTARTPVFLPRQGDVVPARLMSKFRQQERGCNYAEQYLVKLGARPRPPQQDPPLAALRPPRAGRPTGHSPRQLPVPVAARFTNSAATQGHWPTDNPASETLHLNRNCTTPPVSR